MKNITKVLETEEEVKILLDPYRIKIWMTYAMEKKSLTVKQVADMMGEVPSKVHYHVQKLIGIGILELDYTKNINGIIAKYYKVMYLNYEISNNVQNNEYFENVSANPNLVGYNQVSKKMGKVISENSNSEYFMMLMETLSITDENAIILFDKIAELVLVHIKKEDADIDKDKIDYTFHLAILKHTK